MTAVDEALAALLAGAPGQPRAGVEGAGVAAALLDAEAEAAAACSLDAAQVASARAGARQWRNTPTPQVASLAAAGDERTGAYIDWLCAVAVGAASCPGANLDTLLYAAAFIDAQNSARPPGQPAATPVGEQVPKAVKVDAEALRAAYTELDALIGLQEAKAEIRAQAAFHRVQALRAAAGLDTATTTRHLVFAGNPGTGKTTVARLVGRIYAAAGLLERGQLVETDKSGLVGAYLGQTEQRTAEVIDSALGGILFIDEAYALADDDYGRAAVDVLVKAAEDHRDDLVVVLAGYTGPMARLLDTNPGLASRFPTVVRFADYTDDELAAVFAAIAARADYKATPEAVAQFRARLAGTRRGETFGNARFARNCFDDAILAHAWRLRDDPAPDADALRTITGDDVEADADDDGSLL